MAYEYSLIVNNHAAYSNYLMVFQDDPGSFHENAKSVAWFSKYSNPGPNVSVKFTWTIDWGFSWAETGKLAEGVLFEASDVRPASDRTNQITLDYNGAYQFVEQQAGPDPNRLYIRQSPSIPVDATASVGITMSGKTVYATQARPRNNITASPHPQYYVAYGNYVEGQVLDISTVNDPLRLSYETGVYSLTTTLNKDGSWTPPTTALERNTRFLEARKKNPELCWTDSF